MHVLFFLYPPYYDSCNAKIKVCNVFKITFHFETVRDFHFEQKSRFTHFDHFIRQRKVVPHHAPYCPYVHEWYYAISKKTLTLWCFSSFWFAVWPRAITHFHFFGNRMRKLARVTYMQYISHSAQKWFFLYFYTFQIILTFFVEKINTMTHPLVWHIDLCGDI